MAREFETPIKASHIEVNGQKIKVVEFAEPLPGLVDNSDPYPLLDSKALTHLGYVEGSEIKILGEPDDLVHISVNKPELNSRNTQARKRLRPNEKLVPI